MDAPAPTRDRVHRPPRAARRPPPPGMCDGRHLRVATQRAHGISRAGAGHTEWCRCGRCGLLRKAHALVGPAVPWLQLLHHLLMFSLPCDGGEFTSAAEARHAWTSMWCRSVYCAELSSEFAKLAWEVYRDKECVAS